MDIAVQESLYNSKHAVPVRGAECSGSRLGPQPAAHGSAQPRAATTFNDRGKSETTVKFWEKKEQVLVANRGIARAALEGASRLEIAGEALHELREEASADRIGIWLASAVSESVDEGRNSTPPPTGRTVGAASAGDTNPKPAWRGVVWDRESESTPAAWEHLSGEAPLPQDLVLSGRAVEQELPDHSGNILIGMLIGQRKVLWVPIESRGGIQGVIFCGTREKRRELPRALCSRLAAELALQLAWEDERAVARERYADIALARRVHRDLYADARADSHAAGREDGLADGHADRRAEFSTQLSAQPRTQPRTELRAELRTGVALARIADSIVDAGPGGLGIGAAFATIGVLPDGWSREAPAAQLDFRWKSGDADWLRVAESVALAETWQAALRNRRATGISPQAARMDTAIARIVALPVEAEGELCGAMLVGLFPRGTSLAAFERLEYRAALAGQAVARRNRERRAALAAQRQRTQLAATRACLLVLDARGRVVDLSAGAEDLVRHGGLAAVARAAPDELFEKIFRDEDRLPVAEWLQRGEDPPSGNWPGGGIADRPGDSPAHSSVNSGDAATVLLAHLRNGIDVHLRRELPDAQGQTVVSLEKVSRENAQRGKNFLAGLDSEQALDGVIEWLEEGVVLFDTHGNVRARNTRFAQLAGLAPAASAKGATLEQLIAHMAEQAAEPAEFAERWRNLARGIDGGVRDELRMNHPTARILERTARPVLDAAGNPLGRVEVYRDLTAQRLFQTQLLQTEKLAALGQMVSGIAHELSNPLTSILGYAQRLLLREDGAGRLPEARQIFQEAERASGILRQLLYSARETPPERRRVALNQVVLRSMELQRFSMATEKVRIELDLDPSLPAVIGDAAQLQQVLINLVGNARQAIEQKGAGGRIRVRTKQVAERRVQLEIEDDGPGVPQSILARIFDPFFTTKAEGVGTGLGLSIVLGIVREHGGRVNVLNAPEGGAIFSVELPVAEGLSAAAPAWPAGSFELRLDVNAATSDEALVTMAENHLLAKRRAPTHGRVLVVEDEPTVARLIADVLQDEGLTVDVLLDGREGLKRAAKQHFDLAICDMRMPGLDGQQFYQSLVRSGNELQHNFLFVTGDVIAPATQAFLESHRLPHLAKPFRVEELTERVRDVLQHRHAGLAAVKHAAAGNAKRRNVATKA